MEELVEGQALADRYLLGPLAGQGAVGRVHLAEDLRLARPVAVKSLRPELARHPEVRQRFGQEARAAARISHPNVVRVYDSGEEDGIPYLVMECLPGSTLVDELAWGPLDPARARRVGLDVLDALDAAHRLGIVHRDVKPGNMLLSAAIDGPVKVSDFGIAKSTDDHGLTDSGSLVGTAAYLAPERVAGRSAGPASDLYSLGVVLYEAVAGRRPYQGDTSLAIALAIHMGGAPRLLELRPDLDPAFAEVVERAIAHDPAERWASAPEMAAALRRWRPEAVGDPAYVGESHDGGPSPGGDGTAAVSAGLAATSALAGSVPAGESATAVLPVAVGEAAVGAPGGDPTAGSGTRMIGRRRPAGDLEPSLERRRHRRRTGALCAGGAAVVLAALIGGATLRGGGGRTGPVAPPTTVDPVAAAAPSTAAQPEEGADTRSRPAAASSTVPRRAAPAPTSTSTSRPPVSSTVRTTTTRAPTTTTPTTAAPTTTPTTVPAAVTGGPPASA